MNQPDVQPISRTHGSGIFGIVFVIIVLSAGLFLKARYHVIKEGRKKT